MMISTLSFSFSLYTETGKKKNFFSTKSQKTKNFATNTAGIITEGKNGKFNIKYAFGFDILNEDVELEMVKIYVVTKNKATLLVESKMPNEFPKKNSVEKGKYFVEMEATVGTKARVSDMMGYSWIGQSEIVATIDNIQQLLSRPKYNYLFKFVMKAKGQEEEVIYQPATLGVKLVGVQN